MNKKTARINFFLVSLLLIIAIVLCFAQFKMPFSNTNYNGLINSISATSDISDGNSATYKIVSEDVTDKAIEDTIEKMRDILNAQGFANSSVYRQGSYIRAEVEGLNNAGSLLNIIGTPKTFFISSTDKETITEEELADFDIVGTDVKTAYSTSQMNLDKEYNGITIKFNATGAQKLKELTETVSATENSNVYFYIGGEKSTSLEVSATTNNFLSFYSEGYSQETAKEYALQIMMASTGVDLKIVSNNTSSSSYGHNVLIYTLIAMAIVLFAVLILMPILYGDYGFLADLSILCGVVTNIFFLQAFPITTMSLAGIIGFATGLAVMVICHIIYLNKIKSEFAYTKKLPLAVKTGFKKSWLSNLDICTLTFIGAVALSFWKAPFISTFGVSLALGAFIALFNTVILLKDFVTWYLPLNSTNYKKLKFTKGESNEN